ncbi:MAG TPA: DUF4142 domain-containing protein [Vicinamibacterales bacterium]|nr:DUF4142 domain-containing protein [Vicinamibacterales bacterium]
MIHRISTLSLAAALVVAVSGSAFAQAPHAEPKAPAQSGATKPAQGGATKPAQGGAMKPAPGAAMKSNSEDTAFAQKAAAGGKHEVAMAKMAVGKAKNADVKALATKLVADHTQANQELMGLMKTKHIAPGPAAKAEAEPWRTQSGAAFERGFVDHAIAMHEKDIAMFEAEANGGTDAELKAWAEKKLPALREHLKMAQDAKSKLQSTTDR